MDPRTNPARAIGLALLLAPAFLAAGCMTEAAEQEATRLEIFTNTAESYYQLGDNDRAIGQAIKALEIDPDDLKLKLILGWSLQRRGTTEDVIHAEQVFRSIADEDDFRAPLGLASALERQGVANAEAADAIESGKRLTDAADPQKRAAELRARSLALWTESEQWFTHTLEMEKSNLDALNGLQRVHALLGKREASLARSSQMLEALKTDREFWEVQLKKARMGEREEKEIRRTVGQIVDLEVATRLHAARMEYELGRKEAALTQLDIAIQIDPERADLHGMRAVVQKDFGRWDQAIADAERFIALTPQGPDSADVKRAFDLIGSCEAKRARGP